MYAGLSMYEKNLIGNLDYLLETNYTIQNFATGNEPIIVIDKLNQDIALFPTFGEYKFIGGYGVRRSYNYNFSERLHSSGCNRAQCTGIMGIKRIILGDPIDIAYTIPMERVKFEFLALQAPKLKFIEIDRIRTDQEELFFVNDSVNIQIGSAGKVPVPNMIKIMTNGKYEKEIDYYAVVQMFSILKRQNKTAFIQSCDKYKWISSKEVKENQVMPFFLGKNMLSPPEPLVLMGFECSYDCTSQQLPPFTEDKCKLKPTTNNKTVLYL